MKELYTEELATHGDPESCVDVREDVGEALTGARVGSSREITFSGEFLLARHTSRKRLATKLRWIRQELMRRRHLSIKKQGLWLGRIVAGYLNYHAIPTNIAALQQFRKQVTRHWKRALRRRSQKDRTSWSRMTRLADRWLPVARIQHPWPTERFDARTRGGSPVR